MNLMPLPLLLVAIVVPVVWGFWVARQSDQVRARRHATAAALLVLFLAAGAAVLAGASGRMVMDPWSRPPGAASFLLGVDPLSAPLVLLAALITLVTIIARPRRVAASHTLGALLITEGLVIGLFTALHLGLLAVFWVSAAVPALLEARRRPDLGVLSRTWAVFLVAGAVPLVAAVLVLAFGAADTSLHLTHLAARGLHTRPEIAAGMLIGLAVLLRSAAFPVHSWVPTSFEHGPPGMVTLLWAAQPAAYLLARVLLPLFPAGAGPFRAILVVLGLVSALYAALLGLAQVNLKRMVGCLAAGYGGIMLVGLASFTVEGVAGALVLWISAGVAITGLSLVAVAVEARTGTVDMRRLGGLARTMPRLAVAFLVFALAAVGLPGMLGFVAEDMLVHGVLESYPALVAVLLVATAVNAIMVVRAYARVFLGAPALHGIVVPPGRDLMVRERVAVLLLAAALVLFGLVPAPAVAARAATAVELVSPAPDAR